MDQTENQQRFRRLAIGLKGRASAESEREVGSSFDSRVDFTLSLADHQEAALGLEILASNVYEYGIPITADELAGFRGLSDAWGIDDSYFISLQDLIR